jgi:hypothetical protein
VKDRRRDLDQFVGGGPLLRADVVVDRGTPCEESSNVQSNPALIQRNRKTADRARWAASGFNARSRVKFQIAAGISPGRRCLAARRLPGGAGISSNWRGTAVALTAAERPVKRLALFPRHPDRNCWGCDLYCPADDMRCGNGTIRALHPIELFGSDWLTEGSPPAGDNAESVVETK